MKQEINFYETQRMSLIYNIISIVFMLSMLIWVALQKPFDLAAVLITAGAVVFVELLFIFTKLDTKIDEYGVYVRMLPFQWKFAYYDWQDIENVSVKRFNGLTKFSGLGMKIPLFVLNKDQKTVRFSKFRDKVYLMGGNFGLQLELKNGKRVIISTKREEEIEEILDKRQKIN